MGRIDALLWLGLPVDNWERFARCVGSNLARTSFREVARQVFERLHDLRIDTAAAKPYVSVGINSGWSALPATFTPGARTGDNTLPLGHFGLEPA